MAGVWQLFEKTENGAVWFIAKGNFYGQFQQIKKFGRIQSNRYIYRPLGLVLFEVDGAYILCAPSLFDFDTI